MKLLKDILLVIISILLGATFLYSAYTKTIPIQTFEYTLVEFVHMPWWLAAVSSRLFVGLEAALALLLLLNVYGERKWVLKFSIGLLMAFNIYLVYLWVAYGNDVNCGCFGDAIWMSPSSSLIKNIIMLIAIMLLYKLHKGLIFKFHALSSILATGALTISSLFIFPIPDNKPTFLNDEAYEIDFSALYNPERKHIPKQDLSKGKHIVSFMSLTCPHCKKAAYKMQLMKKDNPTLPFYFVLNGDSSKLEQFWDATKAEQIPHTMLLGRDFIDLSGLSLPAIYWVEDGTVEADATYLNLDQNNIEQWLLKE